VGAVRPEQIQHDFYTATAHKYDDEYVHDGDEHFVAFDFISALIDGYGFRNVLDVGSGTGRGVKHFLKRHDNVEVRGVEPVRALIDEAERSGVPEGCIIEGSGSALPFEDNSFDVVCESATLHHVADPDAILAEMIRVARRAVFLSDENRFGNGRPVARATKFALYHLGLWPAAFRLAHGGRDYLLTEGDGGVAYSYSVYDSLEPLNDWADRTFFVPLTPAPATRFHPLFATSNLLLCALRDPSG
jgi:ubiquinone/menaquinone biosynthesis C-methylase UbiE